MKIPQISVLMSTYNTPNEWLIESIDSILNQTFTDFEFIIVDDCSTKDISIIKEKFDDDRIVWVKNERNLGLTKSLNKILKMARGKYIARMDADDISLPERFEAQVKFMEEHPEIIVCGSYRRAFGDESKDEIWNLPKTREEQQVQLFFFNCGITHPTAMFRKSMLDKYNITYNESYTKAQDYGIWVQCTRYAPMAMVPQVLLKYRKSEQQISNFGKSSQRENAGRVKIDQLKNLNIEPTEREKKIHIAFCVEETYGTVKEIKAWVDKLKRANRESGYFNEKFFEKILEERWYKLCKKKYVFEKDEEFREVYKDARTIKMRIFDISLKCKRTIANNLFKR